MYALRERRQHVTQEDFEFAVAKVSSEPSICSVTIFLHLLTFRVLFRIAGAEETAGGKYLCEQALLMILFLFSCPCVGANIVLLRCFDNDVV
jgi:hypothetical protein